MNLRRENKMMMTLAVILALIGGFYWATFLNKEAKDERGAQIQGKASSVVLMIFIIGFTVITISNLFSPFTNAQFQNALSLCFSLVIITNALSIMYYKKRI
ncbi:DUF2178 domain-containing protein (plasmid) [Priestia aryabhattai]|jgi:uncharacterized membrane protein|nr:DUF2178 domain-containing protein [Priestia megaterium]